MRTPLKILFLLGLLFIQHTAYAHPQGQTEEPGWTPKVLGLQFTAIGQSLSPFHAPYNGTNSLTPNGDVAISQTFGVYMGSQLTDRLQAYMDVEMAKGFAVGNTLGLGGPTNGDVIRQGSADLGTDPYIAKAFVKYIIPMSSQTQDISIAQDQLPSSEAVSNIYIKAGKMTLTDDFDKNRYANSTRTQFQNWGLMSNTAWDFAADTRAYSNGAIISWVNPTWAIRYGIFQMPKFANGNILDSFDVSKGENLELTYMLNDTGTTIRVLGYNNVARMGNYNNAVAVAAASGTTPNIVADDKPGRTKYGYGINIEHPIADNGETGLFARYGWNDGKNESFAFAEVDEHLSIGGQLSGTHWTRDRDVFALAFLQHGLSADHQKYLAAGGSGFLLGDGKLNYAKEIIIEAYYRWQLNDYLQIGPDVQYIINPGYNQDRGPAFVASFRIHMEY